MTRKNLRKSLESDEFILAPGIQDMISALICNKVGYEFIYASGYWTAASTFGLADVGVMTYSQMRDRVELLANISDAGVIADADTGFGGLLNIHTTIQGFEAAGAVGIQIEDQEFPKKCGHTPGKKVIPLKDMVEKVTVACQARKNPDTIIIARTDARQTDGFEAALERGEAYAEAGADLIFVEALLTRDEMNAACDRMNKPMMANMADGGKTPIIPADELKALGYDLAIYPAMASLSAAAAVERSLLALKSNGSSLPVADTLYNFEEFTHLVGFPEVWELEKKWAKMFEKP